MKRTRWAIGGAFGLCGALALGLAASAPRAAAGDPAAPLLALLDASYKASCGDVDKLHDYYLADAEIISAGREDSLDATIKELKRSMASLQGLTCRYEPRVRARRVGDHLAYLLVRETIRMAAHEMPEQRLEQICTYVFTQTGTEGWRIAHDHCSPIPGGTA